jgi:Mrp family chromosome partitioning ATPase
MLLQSEIFKGGDELVPSTSLNGYLAKVRREFEYSIVEGPPAGESSEAAALGRSADGIILIFEAHRTRRVVARKIKDTLDAADVRVLGIVLTRRKFPIPEGIYRSL